MRAIHDDLIYFLIIILAKKKALTLFNFFCPTLNQMGCVLAHDYSPPVAEANCKTQFQYSIRGGLKEGLTSELCW